MSAVDEENCNSCEVVSWNSVAVDVECMDPALELV